MTSMRYEGSYPRDSAVPIPTSNVDMFSLHHPHGPPPGLGGIQPHPPSASLNGLSNFGTLQGQFEASAADVHKLLEPSGANPYGELRIAIS